MGLLVEAIQARHSQAGVPEYTTTPQDLIDLVAKRLDGTKEHMDRVAGLAIRLGKIVAQEYRMSEEKTKAFLEILLEGCEVHDVGKLEFPNMYNKPGKFTDEERKLSQRHPHMGVEMLRNCGLHAGALFVVGGHHESFDGSGYDSGLQGDKITLAARVAALVDKWDALVSSRSYRSALGASDAMKYLANDRDKIDPHILMLFLKNFQAITNMVYPAHEPAAQSLWDYAEEKTIEMFANKQKRYS